MKCPKCGGTGFVPTNVFGVNGAIKCDFCDGTGVFITNNEEPQTNEEWIKSANTEQLAEVIGNIAKNAYQCGQNGKTNKCVNRNHCTGYCDYGWGEWLKQPHTKE